jgi:hypothetical protein
MGGWVDPRAVLDDLEKRKFLTLPGLERRPLSRPARSQSLYRLRYPSSEETEGQRKTTEHPSGQPLDSLLSRAPVAAMLTAEGQTVRREDAFHETRLAAL